MWEVYFFMNRQDGEVCQDSKSYLLPCKYKNNTATLSKQESSYIYYSTALGTKDIDEELLELSIKRTIHPYYS
jgi:hypothetical protein